MNFLVIILFSIVAVTCFISGYLIGLVRGKNGQKEIIKYIYKQEERIEKPKGFSSNSKETEIINKKKKYTIN